jgi:hypothetical protein
LTWLDRVWYNCVRTKKEFSQGASLKGWTLVYLEFQREAVSMRRCFDMSGPSIRTGLVILLCLVLAGVIFPAGSHCAEKKQARESIGLFDDHQPPEITCPPDVLFECDDIGDFGIATAIDDVDPNPTVTYQDSIVFQRCPYEYTMLRKWTARDASGNSSVCWQKIEIMDTTPAVFTYCPPDTTVPCGTNIGSLPHATAIDNCNPDPEIRYEVVMDPGPCAHQFRLIRSWEVHDGCCNLIWHHQIVTIKDESPPALVAAPDSTLGCNREVVFTEPEVVDNCDPEPEVTIKSTTVEPGPGICDETHTRCWVASDACGNISEPVCQTLIVTVDTIPPVLTCAPDKTIPFGSPVIFDEPEVSDNCMEGGEIEIEPLSSFTSLGPEGQESYTQCWIVFDQCGNASNECCQTITVEAEPSPYCTFACWDWCAACLGGENEDISTKPACIRDEYFYDVFPGGVVIGDPSRYTARWTSPEAVEEFGCGYGIPWPLRRNYVDPERNELGVLAGEILALRLNREFSCEGYLSSLGYGGPDACYGDYVIPDSVAYFGGLTIDEFLDVADQGVAGNTAAVQAYGANINHLWATAVYLNWLYSDCGGQFVQSDSPPNLISGEDTDEVVEPVDQPLPGRLELTVRPNPLTAGTTINLALPTAADISLDIYDVQGRKVATIMSGGLAAGCHTADWNGSDQVGNPVGSGVYFCRLRLDGRPILMQKLMKL